MTRKRIVYVQYTNPAAYPPLEHSSRILADEGWEVLFLGTGAMGSAKLVLPAHERIRVRQLRFVSAGWKQKLHFLVFQLWCLAWLLRWRPSWVYVSDLFSCPAARLADSLGISTVFHEHDTPESDNSGPFMRMLFEARAECAKKSALCVIPNPRRGEYIAATIGLTRKPLVVFNCPGLDEVVSPRPPLTGHRLRLLYHGSIVPARLPIGILDAHAALPAGVTLTVAGYETAGSKGYVARLRRRAAELGISDRLETPGTLPMREELMSLCRQHDVGLALMPLESTDLNLRTMAGASNKPFDYLACGLALIVSRLPEWEEMFVEGGYGLACDPSSAESLEAAIGWFYRRPDETRAMGEKGRQKILREWNYEYQFHPVKDCLSGQPAGLSVALPSEAVR